MVSSLYKSFLQSHRVAEINLKEIGPTCVHNAVEKISAQTRHQTNKLILNFWLSSTIIPLLILTLKSDVFGRSYSGQLMVGMVAIAKELEVLHSSWYHNEADCSRVAISDSAALSLDVKN